MEYSRLMFEVRWTWKTTIILFSDALRITVTLRALHSSHAQLQAIDEVIRIVIHLITILQFMQIQVMKPVKIFIDDKSVSELCTTLKTSHKTSAMNIRVTSSGSVSISVSLNCIS
jgi:hypothetical protein